jgi:hypothetical protein
MEQSYGMRRMDELNFKQVKLSVWQRKEKEANQK